MRIENIDIKDFCVIGNANISMANQGLVLVLGSNNDTDAADSNGSGKTTIFKALTWCLYGCTIDGEKSDGVIRKGASRTRVAIILIDDQEESWEICRTRGSSEKLSVISPKGQVVESKDILQLQIEKLLGFDFHAFRNTVLYGQQDLSRFSSAHTSDSQRKDILHRILRTSLLKKCEKWSRSRLKALEKEAMPVKIKAQEALAAFNEHDVDNLKNKELEWNEKHGARINKLKTQCCEKEEQLSRLKQELKTLPEKIAEVSKNLCEPGDHINERELLQSVKKKAEKSLAKAKETLAECAYSKRLTKESLDLLKGKKCLVCSSELTNEAPQAYINNKLSELEEVDKQIFELKKIRDKCEAQSKKTDFLIEQIEKDVDEFNYLKSKLSELENKRTQISKDINIVEDVTILLNDSVKDQLSEVNPYEGSRQEAEKRIKQLSSRLAKINKLISLKEDEIAHFQFWVKGFSGQGLPSFVLDSAMPTLTERANHYLEILSDGDITMNFDTRTTLKSGEVRDKINISWVIEGIDDTTPSRGQERKMEIATDLALMDLAETREGGSLDLLLLDEVLDGLDQSGRARVIDLLHELQIRRRSIFVISHDPLMAEVFEKVITVAKSGQVSSMELC
jgi:DNA repair exonuclease SbcCD ATPase subunit